LPTAAGLGALAVGLLAQRPDAGWVPLLLGDTVGAGAARRLLPIVLAVPVAVGWLAKEGSQAGLYSPLLQLALTTGVSIGLLAAITLWAANRFNRLSAILATEHKLRESQQRLMEAQADLIHVSRVSTLGAMGSTLAHELNQPLTAIMNYLAVARRIAEAGGSATPRELRRALKQALGSTERAAEIIRRLRAFVIKGEIEKAPHDINTIIEDTLVLALAGGVLRGAGTQIHFDPAARWVMVDPIQIQQVLNNLLRNAVNVMEGMEHRNVTVSTRRDGAMVEVSVADTGPGVADGDYERLFTSFYGTTGDGMGLGLSISRTIVEAHAGRIWAEPGEPGTVFRFTLPAAVAPRVNLSDEAAAPVYSGDNEFETDPD
jgi:C4-dicarboxylate-specific signal transduction histidine kinase